MAPTSNKTNAEHSFVTKIIPIHFIKPLDSELFLKKNVIKNNELVKLCQDPYFTFGPLRHTERKNGKYLKSFGSKTVPNEIHENSLTLRNFHISTLKKEKFKNAISKKYIGEDSTDRISKRLYTEYPLDLIKSVTDFDKKYFKLFNNLSHQSSSSGSYKYYKSITNKTFILKHQTGYINDVILEIDDKYTEERYLYHNTETMLQKQINNFEKFIAEDYMKSMNLLIQSENLAKKLTMVANDNLVFSNRAHRLRAQIFIIKEKYTLFKLYQKYLFTFSPVKWQKIETNKHFNSLEPHVVPSHLFPLKDSFTELREEVLEQNRSNTKPNIYFAKPSEITDFYRNVEKQIFDFYRYVTQNSEPLLTFYVRKLKNEFNIEIKILTESEKRLQNCINILKHKADFKKCVFYRILHKPFFNVVTSEETLKLTISVEYCYEKIFGANDTKLSLKTMTRYIENEYNTLMNKLEKLPNDVVCEAMKLRYASDKRRMKDAIAASKDLYLFKQLGHSLETAFSPCYKANKKKYFVNSGNKKLKKTSEIKYGKANDNIISNEDMDYLLYFTEWTVDENPNIYLKPS